MRQFNQEELVEKIRSERRHMTELYDEINQLKQENASLKEYVKSLKDECISCPEDKKRIIDNWKKTVRRAQVDILEKLKGKLNSVPNGWAYTAHIDELIKEVEDARVKEVGDEHSND